MVVFPHHYSSPTKNITCPDSNRPSSHGVVRGVNTRMRTHKKNFESSCRKQERVASSGYIFILCIYPLVVLTMHEVLAFVIMVLCEKSMICFIPQELWGNDTYSHNINIALHMRRVIKDRWRSLRGNVVLCDRMRR
jgi:hypothetical protein